MEKSLVIVESPAKAKTINKYLGDNFIVKSSVGHIRDLPTSGSGSAVDPKARAKAAAETRKLSPEKKIIHKARKAKEQLIARMGINPEKNWEANYQILPGKESVVRELKKIAKQVDKIYLATDLDREGEAIAWHLQQAIGGEPERYQRVVFNEITKKAIEAAFAKPGELDIKHVEAQQARRFLDRVVGFMLSPLLWAKVARGLSAGRVQSVAVRLIVEREHEIRAFIPEEYWELFADLTQSNQKTEKINFQVLKFQAKEFKPNSEEAVQNAVSQLNKEAYLVSQREDKPTSSKPKAPFITSTLQQAASTRLGFSVKKTMMMAQRLYEAGHITYMRTDSTHLSADAVTMSRDYISKNFGNKYLPENLISYSSKKGAQEAHEAIRPSSVTVTENSSVLTKMERDAQRLYNLIWQQFVACQMMPARYKSSTISVQAGEYELRIKGRIMEFDGYTKVFPANTKDGDVELPDIKVGEAMQLEELQPKQHFTKPAPRYTEASLVKELEKRGIGRPSTYASIISTIQDRGYATLENRRFYAQKIGDIVTERLQENFTDLLDYSFTAKMEAQLDDVANGKKNWIAVLDEFYAGFTDQLTLAKSEEGGLRPNNPTETDIACPKCGRNMQIRTASTGVFLGCSGYALPPKERCKTTINLTPGDEAISVDADDEAESRLLINKHRCQVCDTAMDSYLIDEQRKLHVCGNNPECAGYEVENGKFKIKGYDGPLLECDKCSSDMQLKNGRFGKYFGCSNDECKNTRKLLRNGEAAPPKMDPVHMPDLICRKVDDYYVLRDGAAGIFLAASKFPKNRETRAPLVEELLPFKGQIDPKYDFLLKAPTKDPDGNKAVVRFSRKAKEQYVLSEKDGKPTKWKAFYRDGRWVNADTLVEKA
ncbi:type I DNA topoisomerase [Haliea sp. AH-315-K21]|uniref:DNA topoisomerase 1 n=1 Tax=SAR86 cluster bacterium TaxID=2030880 RepID=A0A2A5CF76_9GAMM|nr:type I DNA topoisomerase [Haliea sp. AH-315-K21]MBN4075168.1 type I DNA topoisomerase [Gammaproteobacteria bacterium AH-315-E17]PCJ42120.1 MAG: DNA topoisomerase I subunit omega [SAR86 cluster bacterium]